MGQAFRRAFGRIRGGGATTDQSLRGVGERRPPTDQPEISRGPIAQNLKQDTLRSSDAPPRVNLENVLEERDKQYDTMLTQMVGRIKSKPGGKLEMGEASVVERYQRPMPKLRNTTPDSSRYEEKPAPTGTLNVAQLRQIMLLHEGKADDHDGPMDIHQIAEKYRLEVTLVQKIIQSLSLPPQNDTKQKSSQ